MEVDPNSPPTEVWHFTTERLRRGEGVQRLEPSEWERYHGGVIRSFRVKGRKGNFSLTECYPTQKEALDQAERLTRQMMRAEVRRYDAVMARLTATLYAIKKDSQ